MWRENNLQRNLAKIGWLSLAAGAGAGAISLQLARWLALSESWRVFSESSYLAGWRISSMKACGAGLSSKRLCGCGDQHRANAPPLRQLLAA